MMMVGCGWGKKEIEQRTTTQRCGAVSRTRWETRKEGRRHVRAV